MTERLIQHIATLVALVALSLGVACTPAYTPQPNGVSFSTGETVAHTTTQQFLSIASEYAWTIEIDYLSPEGAEGWCSLSKTSGEGNENVIMSFGKNPLKESRSLSLSVKFPRESIDLTFTQLAEGEKPEPKPEPDITATPKWLELPAFTADNQEVYFSKHMLPSSGNRERSFSVLYDTEIYHPYWVAYPLCKGNINGSGNRTNDWGIMDPNIPNDKQLYMSSSYHGSYDRGHMLPSASRLGSDADNRQTFYPTNMSPQLSGLNQQKWAQIEGQVRGWGENCDTLYVVTGAVFRTVGGNESVNTTSCRSDSGKQVSIPNYYYKALLQRRGTGSSSSYQTLAIWVPHKAATGKATKSDLITIDRLEELTGIDFFHNLDDTTEQKVESYYDLTYWSGIN